MSTAHYRLASAFLHGIADESLVQDRINNAVSAFAVSAVVATAVAQVVAALTSYDALVYDPSSGAVHRVAKSALILSSAQMAGSITLATISEDGRAGLVASFSAAASDMKQPNALMLESCFAPHDAFESRLMVAVMSGDQFTAFVDGAQAGHEASVECVMRSEVGGTPVCSALTVTIAFTAQVPDGAHAVELRAGQNTVFAGTLQFTSGQALAQANIYFPQTT